MEVKFMNETETTIRKILIAISERANDADENADLYSELGLASVHAMSLLADLEERFGVHIPDDNFLEARSISQLTSMVDTLARQSAHG
jgi:acyl carrier protein